MNLPVGKIELILPKENICKTLDELQECEYLEVIPNGHPEEVKISREGDYKLRLSEVNFALSFLENFKPKESFLKNLVLSFIPLKESVKKSDLEKMAESSDIKGVIERCARIEEKINKLESEKSNLLDEVSLLKRFRTTSVFSGQTLKKTDYFAGCLEVKNRDNFFKEISKKEVFYLEKGEEDPLNFNFVLFFLKKDRQFFEEILKRHEVKQEAVFWREPPRQALKIRENRIREAELETSIQKKEAQKLFLSAPKLKALSDWFSWQIDKEEFLKESEKTRKYFGIKAWVAEEDIGEVEKVITKHTSCFLIKKLPILKDDKPPVIIKNEGPASSFGIVTGVYGLPKRNELDPTPYLAPFFIFYFALALSDSGYGVLLVAFSFLAKKIFKGAGVDRFFNLFIIGGILTTIAGIFSGTVFGSDIAQSMRIIDPMSDPIGTLIFVLALGFFQIFVGLIIGMVWLIKKKRIKEAISGNGAGAVFLLGMSLFLITKESAFVFSGLIAMILLAVLYTESKGILAKLGKGFGAIYGLIGYFSDILSYSRILALGLATGIIAAVINMIAVIFKDMIPIPGVNWLIAGVILVVGHTGNLLINTLGAFIHSARLQFVEFFSKFMEGGGRYFKPLAKQGRFIKIIN